MNIRLIILFAIIIILCYMIRMTKCNEYLTDTEAIGNLSTLYNAQDMKMTSGTFTNKLNVGIFDGIPTDTTENTILMTGAKISVSGAKTLATDLSIKDKTIIDKGEIKVANKVSVGTPAILPIGDVAGVPGDQTVIDKGTITANKIKLKKNILYFRQKVPLVGGDSIAKISYKKDITTSDPPMFFKVNEWIIIIAGIHQWSFAKYDNLDTPKNKGGKNRSNLNEWYINHVAPIIVTDPECKETNVSLMNANCDYWYIICKYRTSMAGFVTDSNVDVIICAIPIESYGVEIPIRPLDATAKVYLEDKSNHFGYLGVERSYSLDNHKGPWKAAYSFTLINKEDVNSNVFKWVPPDDSGKQSKSNLTGDGGWTENEFVDKQI